MSIPGPVGELPLWEAVMNTAAYTCQCTGQCGRSHTKTGKRCDREHGALAAVHGGRILLLAAPADPAAMTQPVHRLVTLSASALAAWCPACHDGARSRAAKQQRATTPPPPDTDALFAL
ncbi:hypothetical protein [Streptacidiphilus carbonis]|uniref:hypothetical protein n=1 Tax=Streptacidiphilus carbonis TaxID=105422 RepID=UPI000694D457|nr:hypothetical protein [Streptacidiphilus carbonis]